MHRRNGHTAGLSARHFRSRFYPGSRGVESRAEQFKQQAMDKAEMIVRRYSVACLVGAFVTGLVIGKLVKR